MNTVGNSREKRLDALAVAVRMANQILQTDNVFHTAEEDLPINSPARNYSFGSLKPGWARRKKGEKPCGVSYMTKKYTKIIRREYGGGMRPYKTSFSMIQMITMKFLAAILKLK